MAYPVIYDVTYSYTGFQQSQGDNSFPGTQIDADLAGLQDSIESLAAFTQNAIRSDGKLTNGLVTYDSLSPSLQTAGLAPADAWVTGTFYAEKANAIANGALYRAVVAHTSGVFATDLAAGKWALVTPLPASSSPGGSNGQLQINNAGVLDGLTDVQLTTRIQPFSSTLSGAVPASGGGTTSFLRADGVFAIPPGGGGGSPGGSNGQLQINNAGAFGGTGTGTGVLTALGVNVSTAGSFVVNGGALGTPSSGIVTNLTGTASININGTVGATIPNAGSFTTLTGAAASANALAVGRDGTTNPALQVDTSVAAGSGVKITSDAAGSGVRIEAISSNTNESIWLRGKNAGNTILGQGNQKVQIGATFGTISLVWSDVNTGLGQAASGQFNAYVGTLESMRWDSNQTTSFFPFIAQGSFLSSVTRTIASAASPAWNDVQVSPTTTTFSGSTNVTSEIAKVTVGNPVVTASGAAINIAAATTLYVAGAPNTDASGGFTPTITTPRALHVADGLSEFNGPVGLNSNKIVASAASVAWSNFYSISAMTLTGSTNVTGDVASSAFTQPVITSSNAITVSQASTVAISGHVTASGSTTITNSWALKLLAGSLGLPAGGASPALSGYINWGSTQGSGGYGIRDNNGTIEIKNSGGSWAAPGGGGGSPGGSSGQIQYNNAGAFGGFTMSGDVTVNTGTGAATIANDAVTYAKMQNVSAASKLLGRGDSGSGDPQEITLGTGLSMSGTTLSSTGGGGMSLLQTDIFTANGTYTRPAGAKYIVVEVIGGGAGGGSGAAGTNAAARNGGGGGSGGAISRNTFEASIVGASVSVTVGATAAGGTGVTGTTTGNVGTAGNPSSFGSLLFAAGGNAGATHNAAGVAAASMYSTATGVNGAGGNGSSGAAAGSPGVRGVICAGAGAGGGGVATAGTQQAGGDGAGQMYSLSGVSTSGGGGAAGAIATNGTAGSNNTGSATADVGYGGGGGGSNTGGNGGAGGNGGLPGGGGGGGGASRDTNTSGAGGNGARGEVRVWTYG